METKNIRKQRKEKGLCTRCGAEKMFETTVDCSDCYANRKMRER
jgi:ribosomal protein L37E